MKGALLALLALIPSMVHAEVPALRSGKAVAVTNTGQVQISTVDGLLTAPLSHLRCEPAEAERMARWARLEVVGKEVVARPVPRAGGPFGYELVLPDARTLNLEALKAGYCTVELGDADPRGIYRRLLDFRLGKPE